MEEDITASIPFIACLSPSLSVLTRSLSHTPTHTEEYSLIFLLFMLALTGRRCVGATLDGGY